MAQGKGKKRKRIKIRVPCFGVDIDQDEEDALSLPPKFATYQKIEMKDIKHQQLVRDTKLRHGNLDRCYDEKGERIPEEEIPMTPEEEIRAEQHRMVFDHEKKDLDFRCLWPTGVKLNPRVMIPRAKDTKDEREKRM